jgi:hypothetical protein
MQAQLSLCLIKYHATKAHEEVDVQLLSFALVSFMYQLHYPEEKYRWSRMISVQVAARGCGYSGFPNLIFAHDEVCTIVDSKCKVKYDSNKDRRKFTHMWIICLRVCVCVCVYSYNIPFTCHILLLRSPFHTLLWLISGITFFLCLNESCMNDSIRKYLNAFSVLLQCYFTDEYSTEKYLFKNVNPLLNPLSTKLHTVHETTFFLSSQILW